MKNDYIALLREIDSLEFVYTNQVHKDASSNMFAFGLNKMCFDNSHEKDLLDFLEQAFQLYKSKISNSFRSVTYCWFDAMAGQIRISFVPKECGFLPFQCDVKITTKLDVITSLTWQEYEYCYTDSCDNQTLSKPYILYVYTEE